MAKNNERNSEIVRLRKSGLTYQVIAAQFGISPTRVGQIYDRETRIDDPDFTSLERRVWGVVVENDLEFEDLLTMTPKDMKKLHRVGKLTFNYIWTTYRSEPSGAEALRDLSSRVELYLENNRSEAPTHSSALFQRIPESYTPHLQTHQNRVETFLVLMKQKGVTFSKDVSERDLRLLTTDKLMELTKQVEGLSDVPTMTDSEATNLTRILAAPDKETPYE